MFPSYEKTDPVTPVTPLFIFAGKRIFTTRAGSILIKTAKWLFGKFQVMIGASSEDIKLKREFELVQ